MTLVTTAPINAVVAHIMQEKQGEYQGKRILNSR